MAKGINSSQSSSAIPPRHPKIQVPVDISSYVYSRKLIAPFGMYLYLKMHSDGKLHADNPIIKQMRLALNMKDNRTYRKHLEMLLQLNWIGHNNKTGYYFIRSFAYIRYTLSFKRRQAIAFTITDFKSIQKYLVGVILSAAIQGQKYGWEIIQRRKSKTATNMEDVAKHYFASPKAFPSYYGLSVARISALLGCKPTRASVLKNEAERAGYIRTKEKFTLYCTLPESDYCIRNYLNDIDARNEQNISIKGRLRFRRVELKDGRAVIEVMEQKHDEIIPLMPFKRITKFNNLRLSTRALRCTGETLLEMAHQSNQQSMIITTTKAARKRSDEAYLESALMEAICSTNMHKMDMSAVPS